MKTIWLIMLTFGLLHASLGIVQKVSGTAKVQHEKSIKKSNIKVGSEILDGDIFTTMPKSSVVLKLKDNSIVALDASSSLHFQNNKSFEQKKGKIYYNIAKKESNSALEVKTNFAIIGIKGTEFIVNAQNPQVMLKEGTVSISSIKQEFELYTKEMQREFEEYAKNKEADFEKFKNEQNPALTTKSFDLQAGNSISFDDTKVHEKAFAEDEAASFALFGKIIEK